MRRPVQVQRNVHYAMRSISFLSIQQRGWRKRDLYQQRVFPSVEYGCRKTLKCKRSANRLRSAMTADFLLARRVLTEKMDELLASSKALSYK